MQKETIHTSGDPNFAAALMTVGCPPAEKPVHLIAHENGRDYCTFRIKSPAIDGTETSVFSAAWSNEKEMAILASINHPFVEVSRFSRSKQAQTGPSRDAWIHHMADFIGLTVDSAFALMRDVAGLCAREPESPVSYCAAFIENRFHLLDMARDAMRNGDHSIYMTHGSGMSLIHEKAPARIRDYLLSNSR
jgi:hypothetical protein